MSWTPFATFGLGVPESKLVMCLLIMIETSGRALCFVPMQERRKPKSVFRTAENTHHLCRPGIAQKLVPSEPTIHFEVAWKSWKWDLWVILGKLYPFVSVHDRTKVCKSRLFWGPALSSFG